MSQPLTVLEDAPARRRPERLTAAGVAVRLGIGLAVIAALIGLRLVADPAWTSWLPTAGRDFVTLSLSVLVESLPFVFLGIAISILVQIWLPDRVWDLLPRNPVLRRMTLSVLGVVFPVCECGNVPMARGLMMRGLGVGEGGPRAAHLQIARTLARPFDLPDAHLPAPETPQPPLCCCELLHRWSSLSRPIPAGRWSSLSRPV